MKAKKADTSNILRVIKAHEEYVLRTTIIKSKIKELKERAQKKNIVLVEEIQALKDEFVALHNNFANCLNN